MQVLLYLKQKCVVKANSVNHVNLALVIQRQHEGVQILHVCR